MKLECALTSRGARHDRRNRFPPRQWRLDTWCRCLKRGCLHLPRVLVLSKPAAESGLTARVDRLLTDKAQGRCESYRQGPAAAQQAAKDGHQNVRRPGANQIHI